MLLPLHMNLGWGTQPVTGRPFQPEESTFHKVWPPLSCSGSGLVTDNDGVGPQLDPTRLFRLEGSTPGAVPGGLSVIGTDNGGTEPQPDPIRQFKPDR